MFRASGGGDSYRSIPPDEAGLKNLLAKNPGVLYFEDFDEDAVKNPENLSFEQEKALDPFECTLHIWEFLEEHLYHVPRMDMPPNEWALISSTGWVAVQ